MFVVWSELIARWHAQAGPWVVAVTGGGVGAVSALLTVPGGSQTILEAVVPYSTAALTCWLGKAPDQFCAEETALVMAATARQRAADLAGALGRDPQLASGLGCTASLASARPKRGLHRCFIATHSLDRTVSYRLVLDKGARGRAAEDDLVSQLILTALAEAIALDRLPALALRGDEILEVERQEAWPAVRDVLTDKHPLAWRKPGGEWVREGTPIPVGLLSGAFHPLHAGHRELRDAAAEILGGEVGFELSLQNVDKPPLDYLSLARRSGQFVEHPLVVTRAPTFLEKARVLPGTTFVVGADTALRIVHPRYYHDRPDEMQRALREIRARGCRFLVAGRRQGDAILTLDGLDIPAEFRDLFVGIPLDRFRRDLSSTELRQRPVGGDDSDDD